MLYARVVEGVITEVGVPTRDPILVGEKWYDCRKEDQRELYMQENGWVPVQETPKPPDTDTHTHDRSFVLNEEGVPVETWTQREWTDQEEDVIELNTEREQLIADLRGGYAQIEAAGVAAFGDIETAAEKRQNALALAEAVATQRTQISAWVSQTTTTAARADLYAIRDQLVIMLNRQEAILAAFAEMLAYRRANDENVVVTSRALMWAARFIGGRV